MTSTSYVAVLVGSLRKESLSRKMAHALAKIARGTLDLRIIEIGTLPLYDADWEAAPPAAVGPFRNAVRAAEAILFVTPEYNRSVPGALKDAIDVGSRPYGRSVWSGKPGAVVSLSPGALAVFGANHHLRQSMVFLDVQMLQQPELYIGQAATLFAADGTLAHSDRTHVLTQCPLSEKQQHSVNGRDGRCPSRPGREWNGGYGAVRGKSRPSPT